MTGTLQLALDKHQPFSAARTYGSKAVKYAADTVAEKAVHRNLQQQPISADTVAARAVHRNLQQQSLQAAVFSIRLLDGNAGGEAEAEAAYEDAMAGLDDEEAECHRHMQSHTSKKSGKTKWTMMEMWPMLDPVDSSPAVLVKRYNITQTKEMEQLASVRQSSLEK